MFLRKNLILLNILLVLILIVGLTISIFAQENVKIGVIYPLTGSLANAGKNALNAINLAVSIVNEEHPDLAFNLAPSAGLPNLNGAKIEIVTGNTQGEPEFGRAEAERLITLEKVDALLGAYQSGVTKTASQIAERYKTPFVTGISTSPQLTERGFKYFFRTTQTTAHEAIGAMQLIKGLNARENANIKTIGMFYENTEFGVASYDAVERATIENGFEMVSNIKFPFSSVDLESEVLLLKNANPDFVFGSFMISDLILFIKTCKKLDYIPKGYISLDTGLTEPELLDTVAEDANFLMTKDVFALDLTDKIPLLKKVNEMYRNLYGADFDGNNIRVFTGIMALMDAINRAGSKDKEAIRKALVETDISTDQLIVTWNGIKFDEKGQNVLSAPIFRQMLNKELAIVYPFDLAFSELVYPLPKWSER